MKNVILVTGATSLLGQKIIKRLLPDAKVIYAGARDPSELMFEDSKVKPIKLDITDTQSVDRSIKSIVEKEDTLDVVVNVAGVTISGTSMDFEADDLTKLLDVNVTGAFRLIKAAYPHMKKQHSGKMVNITSLNGLVPMPNFALYSASKHALEALGLGLHYELKKDGIYVTNIAPGAILREHQNSAPAKIKASHKPAREKFKILYYLMPMLTTDKVAKVVAEVIEDDNPPARVVLGRDAVITSALSRYLPFGMFTKLMAYVWNKK